MGIVDEDIARVKAAADLVQIAGETVALRRVGRRYQGLCPFHAEKTPSFYVNAEEGLFHCFGCQASGDTISFVRDVHHLDFVGAVEWLASRYGITLRYDDAATTREHQRRAALVEAMERAVAWYHERLLSSPDGGAARGYLRSRGYDADTVRQFRLGWAPDDWDALARALRLPDDVLRDTGLGFVNRRQRQQDTFRARLLFPIFDVAGRPVAFGGRILPGGEGPKYKNSPESPLYAKSRTLYALNWAKTDVAQAGEVIVCEGYTDVIAFFGAGLPRAVATCGTALAEDHFRTLKNFARRIVLAYDADAAGQTAAERFYEWEQKYEIDVVVAALPGGADPADVARSDPRLLAKAVTEARPFLEFRLDRVLARADLRSPEGRARAADAALAVVAEHPNELVRDQYLMRVADACRLAPERLRERLRAPGEARGGGRGAPAETAGRPPRPVEAGPEVEALRLLIHRRDEVAERLHPVLFADEVHLAALDALLAAAGTAAAVEAAPPEAGALIRRLAVEDTDAEPDDVIARLAEGAARRALERFQLEARRSPSPTDYAQTIGWLKLAIEQLRDEATAAGTADQLVPWLVQFGEEGA